MRARYAGLLAALGASIAPGVCAAQEEVVVTPDRPSISNSTWTVPPGAAQVEVGFDQASVSGPGGTGVHRLALQSVLRVGVVPVLEARVDAEPFVDLAGGGSVVGHGDFSASFKLRLLDTPAGTMRPSLAVEPFVKPPLAAVPVGSGRADYGVALLLGFPLPGGFVADVNVAVAALGQAAGALPHVNAQVVLNRAVDARLTVFVEGFFATASERGGGAVGGANLGAVWLVHRRLALDVNLQAGYGGHRLDVTARAGVSVLLGR